MKKYLIFNSPEDAWNRNEEASRAAGLTYYEGDPTGCRWLWTIETEDGESPRSAIWITEESYGRITTEEQDALVDELPSDWKYTPLEP